MRTALSRISERTPVAWPAVVLLLAFSASAQTPEGNGVRFGPTLDTQRLCPSGCTDTGIYDAVAFQFVPTSDLCAGGACVGAFLFYSGANEPGDGSTPTVKVSLQTAPLGSGSELAYVPNVGMPSNAWVEANFSENGLPSAGAVALSAGSTYYFVITTESASRPSVGTAPVGVGANPGLDVRTGVDLSLRVFLSHAAAWGSALATDAPVFVAVSQANDPWAPSGCPAPVLVPFGNPFISFENASGGPEPVGEQFTQWADDTCATGVAVQLAAAIEGLSATLSSGGSNATASLSATGTTVDGYQVYSGTFPTGLLLTKGSANTLTLNASASFSVRSYSWGGTDNGCGPQSRATWQGSTSKQTTGSTPVPGADIWFQVSTSATCGATSDGGSNGSDGGTNGDGGALRSWYACSCGWPDAATPPTLLLLALLTKRTRRFRKTGIATWR